MKNSCFWHKKPFLIFLAQVRTKWISESCSTAFLGPLCKNLWAVHFFLFSLSFLQPGILTVVESCQNQVNFHQINQIYRSRNDLRHPFKCSSKTEYHFFHFFKCHIVRSSDSATLLPRSGASRFSTICMSGLQISPFTFQALIQLC